jgi:hypothetical protein
MAATVPSEGQRGEPTRSRMGRVSALRSRSIGVDARTSMTNLPSEVQVSEQHVRLSEAPLCAGVMPAIGGRRDA